MIAKLATGAVNVDDQEQAVHFWVEQVDKQAVSIKRLP
jgi:hypothetical protein